MEKTDYSPKKAGESMKTKKPLLLVISSVLMLICAIPLMLWCFSLIDSASVDRMPGYTYAGAGCFAAAMVYVFSMVTAVAGLVFAKTPHRRHWCRTLALIQLTAGVMLAIPMRAYAALTLPLLLILTVLYLIGARKRKDKSD
jgi:uncharacterized membrane protein HdeD (DUF308 family)